MTSPLRITVGSDSLTANSRVEQVAIVVDEPRQKESLLLAHLRDNGFSLNAAKGKGGKGADREKVLVFALYKKEATRIFDMLRNKGYEVACINGDMSQDKRTQSLADFKSGKSNILVATGASTFLLPFYLFPRLPSILSTFDRHFSTKLTLFSLYRRCRSWSRHPQGRACYQPDLPSHH
jgi:superfamily II DNA/RNA helicase